jgi:hypothetical protein
LRQRNLQPGNQVAENRPGGNPHHQAHHAGRRQQTGTKLPRPREGHQHQGQPGQHDGEHRGSRQQAGLGVNAARVQVVFDINRVQVGDAVRHTANGAQPQPGQCREQQQSIGVAHAAYQRQVVGCALPDGL